MQQAKLRFHYGAMNSGKSTIILTTAFNYEQRGIPFIILKSVIDDRDGECIIKSRTGLERSCIAIGKNDNIYEFVKENYINKNESLSWIFVDEAQFLNIEQINELARIVDDFNIDVQCFGLRTDFQTKLFPGSMRLMEIADKIVEMKSMCSCGNKNIVNARIDSSGKLITQGNSVEIGGEDKYITLCRKCYNSMIKNMNSF